MRAKRTTVRIQDVARAAGVSVSTASRVLNNKGDVSQETYARVREVMAQLGYTASLAARGMRSRTTRVIGLVVPDVNEDFAIEVVRGVGEAIKAFNYDLLIYTSSKPLDTRPSWEHEHIALLNNGLTDGTVVVTPTVDNFPDGSPIVVIDPLGQGASEPSVPSVIATNHVGALEVMAFLVGLGHRRIGFITGRADAQSAIRRFQGYRDGLEQAGIAFDPELVRQGDYTRETARACARELLTLPTIPSAIFAANDVSALGVLDVAADLGMRVPDDLSLVGFDNLPESAETTPRLTTVDQSIREMGAVAVQMLIALLRDEAVEPRLRKVPTRLVVRESCRAIAGYSGQ